VSKIDKFFDEHRPREEKVYQPVWDQKAALNEIIPVLGETRGYLNGLEVNIVGKHQVSLDGGLKATVPVVKYHSSNLSVTVKAMLDKTYISALGVPCWLDHYFGPSRELIFAPTEQESEGIPPSLIYPSYAESHFGVKNLNESKFSICFDKAIPDCANAWALFKLLSLAQRGLLEPPKRIERPQTKEDKLLSILDASISQSATIILGTSLSHSDSEKSKYISGFGDLVLARQAIIDARASKPKIYGANPSPLP